MRKLKVRYIAPNGCNVKWRIFGSDGSNIYIIADDYVSKEYIPRGRKGSEIYVNRRKNYRLSFDDVINDYEGSVNVDKNLRFLNNEYFNALDGRTFTKITDKVVAYMMDGDIWKGFVGKKAEYAIGGPTIEIMLDSHNKLNPANQIECCSSNIGYMIRRKSSIDWPDWTYFLRRAFFTDKVSYIEDSDKACGMWVASPSADGDRSVMYVHYDDAYLGYSSYRTDGLGFRPLVSLKSNVILKKLENEENVYEIHMRFNKRKR